jgi:hypothetical protein
MDAHIGYSRCARRDAAASQGLAGRQTRGVIVRARITPSHITDELTAADFYPSFLTSF